MAGILNKLSSGTDGFRPEVDRMFGFSALLPIAAGEKRNKSLHV